LGGDFEMDSSEEGDEDDDKNGKKKKLSDEDLAELERRKNWVPHVDENHMSNLNLTGWLV